MKTLLKIIPIALLLMLLIVAILNRQTASVTSDNRSVNELEMRAMSWDLQQDTEETLAIGAEFPISS